MDLNYENMLNLSQKILGVDCEFSTKQKLKIQSFMKADFPIDSIFVGVTRENAKFTVDFDFVGGKHISFKKTDPGLNVVVFETHLQTKREGDFADLLMEDLATSAINGQSPSAYFPSGSLNECSFLSSKPTEEAKKELFADRSLEKDASSKESIGRLLTELESLNSRKSSVEFTSLLEVVQLLTVVCECRMKESPRHWLQNYTLKVVFEKVETLINDELKKQEFVSSQNCSRNANILKRLMNCLIELNESIGQLTPKTVFSSLIPSALSLFKRLIALNQFFESLLKMTSDSPEFHNLAKGGFQKMSICFSSDRIVEEIEIMFGNPSLLDFVERNLMRKLTAFSRNDDDPFIILEISCFVSVSNGFGKIEAEVKRCLSKLKSIQLSKVKSLKSVKIDALVSRCFTKKENEKRLENDRLMNSIRPNRCPTDEVGGKSDYLRIQGNSNKTSGVVSVPYRRERVSGSVLNNRTEAHRNGSHPMDPNAQSDLPSFLKSIHDLVKWTTFTRQCCEYLNHQEDTTTLEKDLMGVAKDSLKKWTASFKTLLSRVKSTVEGGQSFEEVLTNNGASTGLSCDDAFPEELSQLMKNIDVFEKIKEVSARLAILDDCVLESHWCVVIGRGVSLFHQLTKLRHHVLFYHNLSSQYTPEEMTLAIDSLNRYEELLNSTRGDNLDSVIAELTRLSGSITHTLDGLHQVSKEITDCLMNDISPSEWDFGYIAKSKRLISSISRREGVHSGKGQSSNDTHSFQLGLRHRLIRAVFMHTKCLLRDPLLFFFQNKKMEVQIREDEEGYCIHPPLNEIRKTMHDRLQSTIGRVFESGEGLKEDYLEHLIRSHLGRSMREVYSWIESFLTEMLLFVEREIHFEHRVVDLAVQSRPTESPALLSADRLVVLAETESRRIRTARDIREDVKAIPDSFEFRSGVSINTLFLKSSLVERVSPFEEEHSVRLRDLCSEVLKRSQFLRDEISGLLGGHRATVSPIKLHEFVKSLHAEKQRMGSFKRVLSEYLVLFDKDTYKTNFCRAISVFLDEWKSVDKIELCSEEQMAKIEKDIGHELSVRREKLSTGIGQLSQALGDVDKLLLSLESIAAPLNDKLETVGKFETFMKMFDGISREYEELASDYTFMKRQNELTELSGTFDKLSISFKNESVEVIQKMSDFFKKLSEFSGCLWIDFFKNDFKKLMSFFDVFGREVEESNFKAVKKTVGYWRDLFANHLTGLSGEGYSRRDWLDLMTLLQFQEVHVDQLTCIDILKQEVVIRSKNREIRQFNIKVIEKQNANNMLKEIRLWRDSVEFAFVNSRQSNPKGMRVICNWEDIFQGMNDNSFQLQVVSESRMKECFEEDIRLLRDFIEDLSGALCCLRELQKKTVFLEPILEKMTLSDEVHSEFRSTRGQLAHLMDFLENRKLVSSVLAYPNWKTKMQSGLSSLESLQNTLNCFLEMKRSHFPRLYLLGDEDLVDLIASSSNEQQLRLHMKKLFQSIEGVVINGDGRLDQVFTESVGGESEKVTLNQGINVLKEDLAAWLTRLKTVCRQTLRDSLAVYDYEGVDSFDLFGNLVANFDKPLQILVLAQELIFTQMMRENGNATGIKRLIEKYSTMIDQFTNKKQSSSKIPTLFSEKCRQLVMHSIRKINFLRELQQNTGQEKWTLFKMMKFGLTSSAENKATGLDQSQSDKVSSGEVDCLSRESRSSIAVTIAGSDVSYSWEYQGLKAPLVYTVVTDRIFITMSQCLKYCQSTNLTGPAGTGKTETAKFFGSFLGRNVLVFNCDESISNQTLKRIFQGFVFEETIACFDEFNRLNQNQLSVASQLISSVQTVLKSKGQLRSIEGFPTVHPDCAITVTMNPKVQGYRARFALPQNLKSMFRTINVSNPSEKTVFEVLMFAEGCGDFESLADQLMSFVNKCRRLLSKQNHYDWSLRKVKSLIACFRNERCSGKSGGTDNQLCLVKSIETNVVSVLEKSDVDKYRVILQEVFGDKAKVFEKQESKHQWIEYPLCLGKRNEDRGAEGDIPEDQNRHFVGGIESENINWNRKDDDPKSVGENMKRGRLIGDDKKNNLTNDAISTDVHSQRTNRRGKNEAILNRPENNRIRQTNEIKTSGKKDLGGVKDHLHQANSSSKEDVLNKLSHSSESKSHPPLSQNQAPSILQIGGSMSRWLVDQLSIFEDLLRARFAVILFGPSSSGKSLIWKSFVQSHGDMEYQVINPRSADKRHFLGSMNESSNLFVDGTFTQLVRRLLRQNRTHQRLHLVVFDSEIDPEWIESLNSMLDDNRLVSLPSGERIKVPDYVKFIFECRDISLASPATLSRLGIINLKGDDRILSECYFDKNGVRIIVNQSVEETREFIERTDCSANSGLGETSHRKVLRESKMKGKNIRHCDSDVGEITTKGNQLGCQNGKPQPDSLNHKNSGCPVEQMDNSSIAKIDKTSWNSSNRVKSNDENTDSFLTDAINEILINHSLDVNNDHLKSTFAENMTVMNELFTAHNYSSSDLKLMCFKLIVSNEMMRELLERDDFRLCERHISPSVLEMIKSDDKFSPQLTSNNNEKSTSGQTTKLSSSRTVPSIIQMANPTEKGLLGFICSSIVSDSRSLMVTSGNAKILTQWEECIREIVKSESASLFSIFCTHRMKSDSISQMLTENFKSVEKNGLTTLKTGDNNRKTILLLKDFDSIAPDEYGITEIHEMVYHLLNYGSFVSDKGKQVVISKNFQFVIFCNSERVSLRLKVPVKISRLCLVVSPDISESPDIDTLVDDLYRESSEQLTGVLKDKRVFKFACLTIDESIRKLKQENPLSKIMSRNLTIQNVLNTLRMVSIEVPHLIRPVILKIFTCKFFVQADSFASFSHLADQMKTQLSFSSFEIPSISNKPEEVHKSIDSSEFSFAVELSKNQTISNRKDKGMLKTDNEGYSLAISRSTVHPLVESLGLIFVSSEVSNILVANPIPHLFEKSIGAVSALLDRQCVYFSDDSGLKGFVRSMLALMEDVIVRDAKVVWVIQEDQISDGTVIDELVGFLKGVSMKSIRRETLLEMARGQSWDAIENKLKQGLWTVLICDGCRWKVNELLDSYPGLVEEMSLVNGKTFENVDDLYSMMKSKLKEEMLRDNEDESSRFGDSNQGPKGTDPSSHSEKHNFESFNQNNIDSFLKAHKRDEKRITNRVVIEKQQQNRNTSDQSQSDQRLPVNSCPVEPQIDKIVSDMREKSVLEELCGMKVVDHQRVYEWTRNTSFIYTQKSKELSEKSVYLEEGIRKLNTAQKTILLLTEEARRKEKGVLQKSEESEMSLQRMSEMMSVTNAKKNQLQMAEQEVRDEETKVNQKITEVRTKLESVLPTLETAQQGVKQVSKANIDELRMLKNVPETVVHVFTALLKLMDFSDVSFHEARRMLSKKSMLEDIIGLDFKTISSSNLEFVKRFIRDHPKSFDRQSVFHVSQAVGPISEFVLAVVRCRECWSEIEPLDRERGRIEDQLNRLRQKTQLMVDDLNSVDRELEVQRSQCAAKMGEAEFNKNELVLLRGRLATASSLVESLSAEKERWAAQLADIRKTQGELLGCSLMASFAILGVRNERWPEAHCLLESVFAFGRPFDLVHFLGNEEWTQRVLSEGVGSNNRLARNILVSCWSQLWPVVVDPSGMLMDFMKRRQSSDYLAISMTDRTLLQKLMVCLKFGKTLILENLHAKCPSFLYPVIRRNFITKSNDFMEVEICGKKLAVSPFFRLMAHNSFEESSNVCLKRCTVDVDNSYGKEGLTDELTTFVLEHRNKELLKQRKDNLATQASIGREVRELESRILFQVRELREDILQDESLLTALRSTKEKSFESERTLASLKELAALISVEQQKYSSIVSFIGSVYLMVDKLSVLSHFYRFSTDFFKCLVLRTFETVDQLSAFDARDQEEISSIFKSSFCVEVAKACGFAMRTSDAVFLMTVLLVADEKSGITINDLSVVSDIIDSQGKRNNHESENGGLHIKNRIQHSESKDTTNKDRTKMAEFTKRNPRDESHLSRKSNQGQTPTIDADFRDEANSNIFSSNKNRLDPKSHFFDSTKSITEEMPCDVNLDESLLQSIREHVSRGDNEFIQRIQKMRKTTDFPTLEDFEAFCGKSFESPLSLAQRLFLSSIFQPSLIGRLIERSFEERFGLKREDLTLQMGHLQSFFSKSKSPLVVKCGDDCDPTVDLRMMFSESGLTDQTEEFICSESNAIQIVERVSKSSKKLILFRNFHLSHQLANDVLTIIRNSDNQGRFVILSDSDDVFPTSFLSNSLKVNFEKTESFSHSLVKNYSLVDRNVLEKSSVEMSNLVFAVSILHSVFVEKEKNSEWTKAYEFGWTEFSNAYQFLMDLSATEPDQSHFASIFVKMCESTLYGSKVDVEEDRTQMEDLIEKLVNFKNNRLFEFPNASVFGKHTERFCNLTKVEDFIAKGSEKSKFKKSVVDLDDFCKVVKLIMRDN